LYLIKIEESFKFFVFITGSQLLVIFGIYILMCARESDATVIKKPDVHWLKKTIPMLNWRKYSIKKQKTFFGLGKTSKRRRLKLLEISGAAAEQGVVIY